MGENTAVDDYWVRSRPRRTPRTAPGGTHSLAGGGRIELAVHVQGGKAIILILSAGSVDQQRREVRSGPPGPHAAGGAAAIKGCCHPKPPGYGNSWHSWAQLLQVQQVQQELLQVVGSDASCVPTALEEHLMLSVEMQKATGLKIHKHRCARPVPESVTTRGTRY